MQVEVVDAAFYVNDVVAGEIRPTFVEFLNVVNNRIVEGCLMLGLSDESSVVIPLSQIVGMVSVSEVYMIDSDTGERVE